MTSSLGYVTSFPCCATSSPCCGTFLIFSHHCLSYGACYGNSCAHPESGGVAPHGCVPCCGCGTSLCYGTFVSFLCYETFVSSLYCGTFVSSLYCVTFVSSLYCVTFVSSLYCVTFVSSLYCVTCSFYLYLQSDVCTLEKTWIVCYVREEQEKNVKLSSEKSLLLPPNFTHLLLSSVL